MFNSTKPKLNLYPLKEERNIERMGKTATKSGRTSSSWKRMKETREEEG